MALGLGLVASWTGGKQTIGARTREAGVGGIARRRWSGLVRAFPGLRNCLARWMRCRGLSDRSNLETTAQRVRTHAKARRYWLQILTQGVELERVTKRDDEPLAMRASWRTFGSFHRVAG